MKSESERRNRREPWPESAERLLESVPGVVSARVEGARHAVSGVHVWYEPTWPVGQVIEAVQECLTTEAQARIAATRFRAIVAHPDRRVERRTRPEPVATSEVGPVAAPEAPLKLVGHRVGEVQEGVVGVEVWIEWQGRTFSGAAMGPSVPPGSLRTPALATLRAIHSCLQILYEGPIQPGLVLESAVEVTVEGAPVVVVALTASEHARPRPLTSAWADEGGACLAVIQATLHATSRTVTRWLGERRPDGRDHDTEPAESPGPTVASAAHRRFTLVDYGVDRGPSGNLDVRVRLSGFGEAVDRRRNGGDDGGTHLDLGACATLDAVHDLLRIGGWNERHDGDLRHAGARRLRTTEHDIVVVVAEALMNGHRVPLAGATSADGGVERAAITATLQATNPLVADRTARLRSPGRLLGSHRPEGGAQA